jgi:hypothetical protein
MEDQPPMTANQYRAALAKLDLTQVGAARLFGVNDVTSRRWAKNGVTGTVAILLRLLLAKKITIADIETTNGR